MSQRQGNSIYFDRLLINFYFTLIAGGHTGRTSMPQSNSYPNQLSIQTINNQSNMNRNSIHTTYSSEFFQSNAYRTQSLPVQNNNLSSENIFIRYVPKPK